MKRVLLICGAVLFAACGGNKAQRGPSGSAVVSAPQWLSQGSGAVSGESGKRLQAVGSSQNPDPKTRRKEADAAAQKQFTQTLEAFAVGLARASDADNANEQIHAIVGKAAQQASGIADHWVEGGNETALDMMELPAFKQAVSKTDGDAKLKNEIVNNADKVFEQLGAGKS